MMCMIRESDLSVVFLLHGVSSGGQGTRSCSGVSELDSGVKITLHSII